MKVQIQVIKVYDIDVPNDCDDPIDYAYGLQTTEIEATGRLIDTTTDHAEIEDGIEVNRRMLEEYRHRQLKWIGNECPCRL